MMSTSESVRISSEIYHDARALTAYRTIGRCRSMSRRATVTTLCSA
jgi:hypothetical protein